MPIVTVILGGALIVIGLTGFFQTGASHFTALIPAAFGLIFELLGCAALVAPAARKHLMHAAIVFAVLGIAGTSGGLMKLPTLLSGGELARPAAVASQSAMAVLCAIFVVLGIRSFIVARRATPPTTTT